MKYVVRTMVVIACLTIFAGIPAVAQGNCNDTGTFRMAWKISGTSMVKHFHMGSEHEACVYLKMQQLLVPGEYWIEKRNPRLLGIPTGWSRVEFPQSDDPAKKKTETPEAHPSL